MFYLQRHFASYFRPCKLIERPVFQKVHQDCLNDKIVLSYVKISYVLATPSNSSYIVSALH